MKLEVIGYNFFIVSENFEENLKLSGIDIYLTEKKINHYYILQEQRIRITYPNFIEGLEKLKNYYYYWGQIVKDSNLDDFKIELLLAKARKNWELMVKVYGG